MIKGKNISLQLDHQSVFKGFNFSVEKGEKVRISGNSGSGKTTLFKLLLGFVKPQEGAVFYKGAKISSENIWEVRRNIAYVSQDMQLGEGSVKDFFKDITGFQANRHLNISEHAIKEKFRAFSLKENQYEQDLNDLSGGEKQRVAIIAAILLNRETYLLDEATSNLDRKLKRQVMEQLVSMKENTILFISHDELWDGMDIRTIDLDRQ